MRKIHPLFVEN